jgi:biopolymer transport protein TolQ
MRFDLFLATAQSHTLWAYFAQSNFAEKVIVLVLITFSFVAWTIMIGKQLDLSRLQVMNSALEKQIGNKTSLLQTNFRSAPRSPYAYLLAAALEVCERNAAASTPERTHSARCMNQVENALNRAVAAQCIQYESKMIFLGSIVSGAPFLGLLGTVWGIMDAFAALGEQAVVTLQTLAPGVSGALLTTVAGLLVAIPSIFGYNYLLTRTKLMVTELENFASYLADRIENEL